MTNKEIFLKEFNLIKEDLTSSYLRLGMKASGQWAESLEVQVGESSAKIIGEKYTEQLVYGRRPGKRPPIDAIKQWIIDKGIVNNLRKGQTVTGLAFAIANKMAKSGSTWFRKGGSDLVSSVITPERMQSIIDKIGINATMNLTRTLEKEFKAI